MSLHELILFISTKSKHSIECFSVIKKLGLDVKVVRLDDENSRKRAMNGEYFQIVGVPTLVAIFSDGKVQLFGGKQKVLNYIHFLTTPKEKDQEIHEDKTEEPVEIRPKRKGSKKKSSKKKKIVDEGEEEIDIEFIREEQEEPKNSRMSSIFERAKQMEQDMKNTYGYKEEDLPKF